MLKKFVFMAVIQASLLVAATSNAVAGDAARGAQAFEKATCTMCHPGGSNTLAPEKQLKGASFLRKYPNDLAIERVVRRGIPNTGMPAFNKDRVSDQDLKDVIAYIRSMTPKTKSSAAAKSAPTKVTSKQKCKS